MTFAPKLVECISTEARELIVAGSGQQRLVNRDQLTTVYLGPDGFDPSSQAVAILDPLGDLTLDGKNSVWGETLSGTAVVNVIPGGLTGEVSPAQIAAQINASGTPPIDNPQPLTIVFQANVPAGGTFTSPRLKVTQFQSWFGTSFGTATAAGTGTNPYYRIDIAWSVASDNFDPLNVSDWVAPITPFQGVYNYRNDMSGPCFGDTVTFTITNYDSQPFLWTYGIFGSFRTRIREKLRGRYLGVAIGESAGLGSDAILGNLGQVNLAPGTGTASQLCDLWDGEADLVVYANYPALNAIEAQLQPQPVSIVGSNAKYVFTSGGVSSYTYFENIALSRRVCTLRLFNNSPTQAISCQAILIAKGINE